MADYDLPTAGDLAASLSRAARPRAGGDVPPAGGVGGHRDGHPDGYGDFDCRLGHGHTGPCDPDPGPKFLAFTDWLSIRELVGVFLVSLVVSGFSYLLGDLVSWVGLLWCLRRLPVLRRAVGRYRSLRGPRGKFERGSRGRRPCVELGQGVEP